jgi:hypothetical protein
MGDTDEQSLLSFLCSVCDVLVCCLILSLSLLQSQCSDFSVFPCEDGWESRWVVSDWKKSEDLNGKWIHTAGKWHGDPADKGALFVSQSCIFPKALFH